MAGGETSAGPASRIPKVPEEVVDDQTEKTTDKQSEPRLPIFSILNSIDFSQHFILIGDVGTGKTP